MNTTEAGRRLFASLDMTRQSYSNLARAWGSRPFVAAPVADPAPAYAA
jgi:hypothetical protein